MYGMGVSVIASYMVVTEGRGEAWCRPDGRAV